MLFFLLHKTVKTIKSDVKLQHLKRRGAKINLTGCEDFENTFAGIESDCTLRFGFKVLIKSILYSLFETKDFETFQQVLRDRRVYVLVMFGNCRGLLFMSFYTIV